MTVTENDIISNAAAIATLINAASFKTIADLDAVTSLAPTDIFHVSVSNADKKITKANADIHKNNVTSSNPTVNSDIDAGYTVGSAWFNSSTSTLFICLDNTAGAAIWGSISGGSTGGGESNPRFAAGGFDYPTSDPAVLDTDTGTNGTIKRMLFDDTTDETVIGQFRVPTNIDTSENVTIRLYGYPSTAAADDVVFIFSHSAAANDESWDTAYTDESSGAKTCINTQDDISIFTWTMAANKWAANDFVRFKLTRDADNPSDDLPGDFGVVLLEVDIPRS